MFLWLSVGAILGALFIRFARSRSPDGQLRVFAVGLVVAAVIYVGFALADGVEWIALEAAGVGLFVLLAYAGLRRSPLLLALGSTLHREMTIAKQFGLPLEPPDKVRVNEWLVFDRSRMGD